MLLIVMLVALLMASCTGDQAASGLPVTPGPPPVVTVDPGNLPPEVTGVRYTGFDEQGRVVLGPVTLDRQPQRLEAHPRLVTLQLETLDRAGRVQHDFVTGVEPPTVIQSPALVASESHDPTTFSFVFSGCNRLGSSEVTSANPSTANLGQLEQDMTDILGLPHHPGWYFCLGDLVLNEEPGSAALQSQLSAWVSVYQAGPLARSDVQLCPITGNHEILVQTGKTEATELPNPATLPVWLSIMAPYIRGSNGPTTAAPNPDGLTFDQSQLSYTFQEGPVAFMMLNTDTFIDTTTNSDIPLNWITGQLQALQADSSVEHIFVMGHRPITSPDEGNLGIRPQEAPQFQKLLEETPKVRAYLCAHAHLWESTKLGKLPQIISGNAGSPLEHKYKKTKHANYGFTQVHIHRSGTVHVEAYGRPVPSPYAAPPPQPKATLREKFKL
ncbi:hypothetical protein DYH09_31190 [bacterium CPR1]|nr:hypothetical protein [bacterium CPR1]